MANKQLQKQLYQARAQYNKWLKKLEAEGYRINPQLAELPQIPKKITPGSVERVKKLTEKLKKTSYIEVNGKKSNRQQVQNRERAIQRIATRSKKRLAKDYGKDEAERLTSQKFDYSDRPDYSDIDSLEPPPIPVDDYSEDIPTVVDYTVFVLDQFRSDIHELADALRSQFGKRSIQDDITEAEEYLDGVVSRQIASPNDDGYAFAKALEEAKRQNAYIERRDLYNISAAEAFMMRVESFINYFDDGNQFAGEMKDALKDLGKAQSNAGYDTYAGDDTDFEELYKPKTWYEDELFGDE